MIHESSSRIDAAFAAAQDDGRAALMPYLPLGFPTLDASIDLVQTVVAHGADMVELGMPFSDPLADGPVIQNATQVALEGGTTTEKCLEAVRTLRTRGIQTPLMLMGYYNPILAYGEEAFSRACGASGVDGLIVPDLPPEEGTALGRACAGHGVGLTYLIAPTSSSDRVRLIAQRSRGFVYLVSVAGVTGARDHVPPTLASFVRRVRAATGKPLAVGFGISTPAQARAVAALADGVIVGSALVRLAGRPDGVERVGEFVRRMRAAARPNH
jgi:tryptophan synthase alpha chain